MDQSGSGPEPEKISGIKRDETGLSGIHIPQSRDQPRRLGRRDDTGSDGERLLIIVNDRELA